MSIGKAMCSRFAQHVAVGKMLSQIWGSYGKLRALISSPFLHISIVLTLMSLGAWWSKDWWGVGMSVIPGLLGFSVATFAVFVAIGDEKFRSSIARGGVPKVNALLEIYSSFLMLIGVQVIALLYAIIASSRPLNSVLAAAGVKIDLAPDYIRQAASISSSFFRFFGWLLLIYSVVAIVPMSLSVFRMAKIYLMHLVGDRARE
ncbi:hypothetical protein [Xanthomonas arboricola]|uniref:hypothetical protein n=1 Tax=Xanthomonas arboricola TaxID=56448 RepID=UPI003EBAABD2